MRGLIFLILVSSNNIFSILEIEILKGSDNLSKIAFIPFGIEKNIDEKYGDQVSSLIEKNMVLFGEFENLNKNEMLSFPSTEEDFYYRDWKIMGVDYSVIGRINSVNALGNLNISYSLFNINVSGYSDKIELVCKDVIMIFNDFKKYITEDRLNTLLEDVKKSIENL